MNDQDIILQPALVKQIQSSVLETIRNLADRTNEHAVFLIALMKHLKVTPEQLMKLVDENDVIDPAKVEITDAH